MRKALVIIAILIAAVGGALVGINIVDQNSTQFIVGAALIVFGIGMEIIIGIIPTKNPVKNRTKFTFEVIEDPKKTEENIQKFLKENKFEPQDYAGETVYRNGGGFFVARKFIAYKVEGLTVTIEGWLSNGLGKTTTIEIPLDDGFYGILPKNKLKDMIRMLEKKLKDENN